GAVAEFGVEDALAEGDVASPRIAEADGAGLHVDHAAARVAVEDAAAHRPLPAGPPAGAAADIGEGVGAFGPVGAPEALPAGHTAFAVDMGSGEFSHEARRDAGRPLAVDAAVGGV